MKRFAFALVLCALLAVLCGTNGLAQSTKVYWMSTVTVPLGRMPDYLAFAAKDLVPEQTKNGYHFIAGWQTIIGDIEEVVTVAEFDNMDAYYKARVALMASPEWKAMGPKMEGLTRGVHTRMMSAVSFIKIQ